MSKENNLGALTALARILAEIAIDREALRTHEVTCAELLESPELDTSRPLQAFAAVSLHAWYTGLETLLERIARQIDRSVPEGHGSHRVLLSQMAVEIPSLRPAVLSNGLVPQLQELLGFRHFFRHAYSVQLDPVRLRARLTQLNNVAPRVSEALDVFTAFLSAAMAGLTSS